VGFGGSSGGVGIGSVIDWTTNPDQGFFGDMADLDQLVLNIPSREELMRFTGAGPQEEMVDLDSEKKRTLAKATPGRSGSRSAIPASSGSEHIVRKRAKRSEACIDCGFCDYYIRCSKVGSECVGCGICIKGCPTGTRRMVSETAPVSAVSIRVDGESHSVPGVMGLADALAAVGKRVDPLHCCETGGCGACAVVVNGRLSRPCCTGVSPDMEVVTDEQAIAEFPPMRVVSFFPGYFHASMSLFTHGCNYGCDFCHNWDLTFSSSDRALTPEQAVQATEYLIRQMQSRNPRGRGVNQRTGISGGEPTLNRRWLVDYVTGLKVATPDVRVQLDTNASVLTEDYIDELFAAGMTDISPDLKGLSLETFQRITGVEDRDRAESYLQSSWKAVEYVLSQYDQRLHVAVAVPYHPDLIREDEVLAMSRKLAGMKRGLDVNLIVYQPAFRQRGARVVDHGVAENLVREMEATGLTVWLQTGEDIPPPTAPDELEFSSEEFL